MKKQVLTFTLLLSLNISFSQNKLITIQEAVAKGRTSLAPKKLQNLAFIPGSPKFYYIEGTEVRTGENVNGKSSVAANLDDVNAAIKRSSGDTLNAFSNITFKNANQFYFENGKGEWIYNIDKKTVEASDKKTMDGSKESFDKETNSNNYAYTKDYNLFINYNDKDIQITNDGNYNLVYGKTVHRDEFGIHKGTYWSPKGNYLAFYRMDQSDVFDYPVIDWSTYPAKSKNVKYPMAGNKSHYVTLGIYDLKKASTIYVKTEGPKDQYLTNIAWSPDEKFIYIAVLNREQNHMKLNEYDAVSGNFVRTLFEEKDEKYVEPLHAMMFVKNNPSQFIWQSRKDGYSHLYLYDIKGAMIKQLTKGKWEVKEVNGFDEKAQRLFYHSNAESPVNQDFYSVNLKSGEMKRLTNGDGFHTAIVDELGNYAIDNFSSTHIPREYFAINTSDKKSSGIFKAENPIREFKTGSWNLFTIKNSEGTDLFCRMFKPVDFDSTKKYPVLVYLYNGPHSQMVTNTWMAGGELWYEYMAQKGFIVFTLDGRGTSNRGKDFEQAIHRQVGTKEMEDQLKGVDYLKSLPYVDANRIGIHGWSYGGFMTTSLMTRYPGVYKVAVAGGPVIDWSYYEIMYGERYMDTPQENKEGYDKNCLLNYVDKLKGKLLMIHGAQDDVVVWQHSVMYQKKAVDKGIQLDYYIYPGHFHNVLGKDRGRLMEKVCNYFIDNL